MTQPHPNEIPRRDVPRAIALVIAATAIGMAIRLGDGVYSQDAIELVTVGGIAAIVGVIGFKRAWPGQALLTTIFVALAIQFQALFSYSPGCDLHKWTSLDFFDRGISTAVVLLLAGVVARSKLIQKYWFPYLLVISLMLNFWMVRRSMAPYIDSWTMQQDGAAQLLGGRNPYDMTFPDIYQSTHPGNQMVYGQGLVVHNQVMFGFPYPPFSLILAAGGYFLTGDHRYAQALAVTLAGLFIGYSRVEGGGKLPKLAASLFMFTPTVFLVIGGAWTEPFVVMLLAAVVFCAQRKLKWLPIALGLALACKQYMILAVPLSFLLLPSNWRWKNWFALLVKSAVVDLVVTLPLALWNWKQFWISTVSVQKLAPFRRDALSYLVWYSQHWDFSPTSGVVIVLPVLCTLAMFGLAIWKAKRSPSGFAAALGLVSLVFFAFNKQAFCNYYFFTIGAFCCAIAASDPVILPNAVERPL